jgi:hypothetical protein
VAIEQPMLDAVFQLRNLLAQRRLRDAAARGPAAKTSGRGHGHEVAQLVQLHISNSYLKNRNNIFPL